MERTEIESGRAYDAKEARGRDGATARVRRGGHPPAEHQWRKGQSGNPAGRPRKYRPSGSRGDRLLGADQPTRTMILDEAYRMVTFVEDGERQEMPLNRAVWRAMGRAALKGNRLAQYRFTQIVQEMEREQHAAQVALYNALEREHYRRNPKASFDDDIVVDSMTGTVVVRGSADG
jgi:hypothetical protein